MTEERAAAAPPPYAATMGRRWWTDMTAGSEAGAAAAAVDWSATPLGVPDAWPVPLRTAVELCFSTRFPVLVTWGPELTMIYNDGYRAMLGSDKHPAAMGAPLGDVWAEVWGTIGPQVERVLTTGEPSWVVDQQLFMERSGFREETFFTYSYSALRDDDGRPAGVLDIATETTGHVVDRRRLAALSELAARLGPVDDNVGEVLRGAIDVLAGTRADVPAADVYLRADDDGSLLLLATTRTARQGPGVPDAIVRNVARSGRPFVHGRSLVIPMTAHGESETLGVIVLESSPYRPLDAECRGFLGLLASTLATALAGTMRRARAMGDLMEISGALQRAMLPRDTVVRGVVARYQPAAGNLAIGGDWYDVIELGQGRRALVVGDCVGHGLRAATLMGQLRSASRALLLEDQGPARTLEGLDRFADMLPGAEFTTVFCAVVDEATGLLTYASAGHPPPLRLHDGVGHWLSRGTGTPLAVRDAQRVDVQVQLAPGDSVVLYTDGLVERRGESMSVSLDRLGATASRLADAYSGDAFADALLRDMLGTDAEDDVALLVYSWHG